MTRSSARLPKRFPIGTKYVVESRGSVVRRYVEFPDGRKITLPTRQAVACTQAGSRHRPTQQAARRKGGKEALRPTFGTLEASAR